MLKDLNASQLQALLNNVEKRLGTSPTKAEVIRTVADEGHCSPSSTTVPATLLKCVERHGLPIPSHFAQLMGVVPTIAHPLPQTPSTLGQPETSQPDKPSVASARLLNLKSVSAIEVNAEKGKAIIHFMDGEITESGSFDVSEFRSNCNLIAFNG